MELRPSAFSRSGALGLASPLKSLSLVMVWQPDSTVARPVVIFSLHPLRYWLQGHRLASWLSDAANEVFQVQVVFLTSISVHTEGPSLACRHDPPSLLRPRPGLQEVAEESRLSCSLNHLLRKDVLMDPVRWQSRLAKKQDAAGP